MANSSPVKPSIMSKGLLYSPVNNLKIASGLLKISAGPSKPIMALFKHINPASVLIAAEAPLESLSCVPALIALKGI